MVSEVMLQQTQVSRVIPKYNEFIRVFPTIQVLAQAQTASVLRLWKGMGYNRRALYLKQASEAILRLHNGVFPASEEALVKLPGVGSYTARAILVFSFKKDITMVDTNIRKIITNFFFQDQKQPEKAIQEVADQLVPRGKSWEWHQALMDFGAASQIEIKKHPPAEGSKIKKDENKIPFKQSTRFFRGRIMDLVRTGDWEEVKLIETLIVRYGKDEDFYKEVTEILLHEGLLARSTRAIISLPE